MISLSTKKITKVLVSFLVTALLCFVVGVNWPSRFENTQRFTIPNIIPVGQIFATTNLVQPIEALDTLAFRLRNLEFVDPEQLVKLKSFKVTTTPVPGTNELIFSVSSDSPETVNVVAKMASEWLINRYTKFVKENAHLQAELSEIYKDLNGVVTTGGLNIALIGETLQVKAKIRIAQSLTLTPNRVADIVLDKESYTGKTTSKNLKFYLVIALSIFAGVIVALLFYFSDIRLISKYSTHAADRSAQP